MSAAGSVTTTGPAEALVLGGGVAGITAAFALSDRGYRVTLWEARGHLGGRAFAAPDRETGELFDNGPHVMLGCYRAMRSVLRRIGSEGKFAHAPALNLSYRERGGRRSELRCARVPTPLALPWALRHLPMSWPARLRTMWGFLWSLLPVGRGQTLAGWLRRARQAGVPADFLWIPLCRALMNAEPDQVEAALFLSTIREAFSGRPSRAAVWIPRCTWLEAVGRPARAGLERAGVAVRTGQRIVRLETVAGADALRAVTAGGAAPEIPAPGVVVSALPWHALARILPEGTALPGASLRPSPILSVHFRSEDPGPMADDGPLVALVDGDPFHFLFRPAGAPPGHFSVLTGGGNGLAGVSVATIEERARQQLHAFDPQWDPATPARVKVFKEAQATFVPAPGILRVAPGPFPLTGVPSRLFVCGDWTAVGLPATLEGAARSAERAVGRIPDVR